MTAPGLRLVSPHCEQVDGDVIATGTIEVVGNSQSSVITVTLTALKTSGSPGTRAATYPSTIQTGVADVPFRIAANTGLNSAYDCDIQVMWGPGQ
ncbi:MAG TPA: hypothetical protein VHO95_02685 [Candidatus Dormibacteraeota bacterium]|nr:hypothetical protein [Candidatus Dormibacteraeota bacterium]